MAAFRMDLWENAPFCSFRGIQFRAPGELTVTTVPLGSREISCSGHRLATGIAECLSIELKRPVQLAYGELAGAASSWQ